MTHKIFSERFNRELSLLDLPEESADKIKAVAIVFNIKRHQANALILGHLSPSAEELEKIAEVLDVCPQWLAGKTEKKKSYSRRESAETTE
jgi:hypothetical protein